MIAHTYGIGKAWWKAREKPTMNGPHVQREVRAPRGERSTQAVTQRHQWWQGIKRYTVHCPPTNPIISPLTGIQGGAVRVVCEWSGLDIYMGFCWMSETPLSYGIDVSCSSMNGRGGIHNKSWTKFTANASCDVCNRMLKYVKCMSLALMSLQIGGHRRFSLMKVMRLFFSAFTKIRFCTLALDLFCMFVSIQNFEYVCAYVRARAFVHGLYIWKSTKACPVHIDTVTITIIYFICMLK